MKKILMMALILTLSLAMALPAAAETASVTFDGDADQFIFAPGSQYSPTDLFPNFKDVMPGDQLYQQITVRNDPSHNCKVKIYMRSLGAHADSVDFLSQMQLSVQKSAGNERTEMFAAAADQTAQLTDWVYLGTLYSGGEVDLDVILTVPVEMETGYSEKVGYLDWQFKVEKFPIEDSDPDNPNTADTNPVIWFLITAISVTVAMFLLLLWRRKKQKEESQNV